MYLRRCYRRKQGKRHSYWALVESYRTDRGPRQGVVAWLGSMDERGRMGVKRCGAGLGLEQAGLLEEGEPEWVEVDLKRGAGGGDAEMRWTLALVGVAGQLELDRILRESLSSGREQIPR